MFIVHLLTEFAGRPVPFGTTRAFRESCIVSIADCPKRSADDGPAVQEGEEFADANRGWQRSMIEEGLLWARAPFRREDATRPVIMPQEPAQSGLKVFVLLLAFAGLGLFGVIGGTLVPVVRALFGVSFSAAFAVQWVPLVGGGILALPIGALVGRCGMVRTLQAGLGLSLAGCLLIAGLAIRPGSGTTGYGLVLSGLFVLAGGATALQVAVNPLMLSVGPVHSGPSRLLLAQATNSLGVWAGVQLSSRLVLGVAGADSSAAIALGRGLSATYLICAAFLAVALVVSAAAFRRSEGGVDSKPEPRAAGPAGGVWDCRWALGGALAIALYVGAEGAIGAMLVSFLHQPAVLGLPLAVGGVWLANAYWGGAALSRLGGAILLRRARPGLVLGLAATLGAVACLAALALRGPLAGYSALATGTCNGVMFPLIFAITLRRTRAPEAAVSALLVFAISGGALVSLMVGVVAERAGLNMAFGIPLFCYAFIAGFAAIAGSRPRPEDQPPQD